jgi:uncharacterized membrane protein
MFKKQDDDFDEMVADPIRRRAQIASLSKRRTIIFICALLLVVFATLGVWLGSKAAAGGVLTAAISISISLKIESDLRLLRTIERLDKDTHDKTTA